MFRWFWFISMIISIESRWATKYLITYTIVAILLIGTVVYYIIDKISEREHERNSRRNRSVGNPYRELPRCRVCGLPIHNIPEIEEKSFVIEGVEIFVKNIPLCCECYKQYKKWSKIIDGGV